MPLGPELPGWVEERSFVVGMLNSGGGRRDTRVSLCVVLDVDVRDCSILVLVDPLLVEAQPSLQSLRAIHHLSYRECLEFVLIQSALNEPHHWEIGSTTTGPDEGIQSQLRIYGENLHLKRSSLVWSATSHIS